MNKKQPPQPALWLLQHLCPGHNNEELTGDLLEKFHEGQSGCWFWKQVLLAIAIGGLSGMRRRWPQIAYAVAGAIMMPVLGKKLSELPTLLRWEALPWPWSMLALDLSPILFQSLAALPVLAIGLAWTGAFRWGSVLRTWIINSALLLIAPYLFVIISGPRPHAETTVGIVLHSLLGFFLFFSIFLLSAFFGCRAPRSRTQHLETRPL